MERRACQPRRCFCPDSGFDMVFEKVTKKSVWWLFDRMIPAVAVVCICIRFGNLMNSEIFGYPTSLPWGFEFVRSREWQELYNQNGAAQPCHPTQIYEMLYCLVALITSWLMYYKFHLQKQIGLITGVSLIIFLDLALDWSL